MKSKDEEKVKDYIGKIFCLAVNSKINLTAITKNLENSKLLLDVENNNFSFLFEKSYVQSFKEIFTYIVNVEDLETAFNDAYWCGYVYTDLFFKYRKPFSCLFMYLPLSELLDMYNTYHESDITQVYEKFENNFLKRSILFNIMMERGITVKELSEATHIPQNTIIKYKKSNQNLYKGNYLYLRKLVNFFNLPGNLFLEKI